MSGQHKFEHITVADHARVHLGDTYYHPIESQFNVHSPFLDSLSRPIVQTFQDLDRSIVALHRADVTSAAIDRLGDHELVEVFNALQYGFLLKCLLNEEFEGITVAMKQYESTLMERYAPRRSWLERSLRQQNPFQEMKPRIEKVRQVIEDSIAMLKSASIDFDFDTDMLKTGPYAATVEPATGEEPARDGWSLVNHSSRPSVAHSLTSTTDARTYFTVPTSQYPRLSDSLLTSGGLHVNKVRPRICVYDDVEGVNEVQCLLDTGSSHDCISRPQRKAWSIKAKTYSVDRMGVRLGNKTTLEVTLAVRLEWRFEGKDIVYSSLFYEVPELAEDIVIGRESIFEHELFITHPEFCTISQAGKAEEEGHAPSLTILDFVTQRKEKREAQEKRAKDQESANRAQREREREDALREQAKKHQQPSSSGTSQSGSGKKFS